MSSSSTNPNRWPPQIKYIVGNEACERFSYYGMKSILAGYITGEVVKGGLGQASDTATTIIHTYGFAVYFLPLFVAWLSDKMIGRYNTILWVSLFYCLGHGVLACSDFATGVNGKMAFLFSGLSLIAFGSGGIKPCVSAFVGDQFRSDQSHLLQKAYGAFYWSINFGSFFSFLTIPWIKNHHGYSWAFAVPGVLMAMATFIFWLGTKHYVRVPPSRETKTAGFIKIFRYALTVIVKELWFALIGRKRGPRQSFWGAASNRFTPQEIDAAKSVGPILSIFALVPVFWALFDQTNSTWVLQGLKMVPFQLFGLEIGAEQMQSANPALVMILVPLLTLGIYPRLGRFASPLKRMSFGLFLTAASYVIVAILQKQIESGAHLSVAWQTLPYIVLTTAEVLVSTTGLEFAFTQAAPEMKSTIMSFWLLTVAFGNLLVTAVTKIFAGSGPGAHEASVSTGRFLMYAGMTFVVAILFSIIAARYRYRNETAV
ncbi:MAG: proton-dependent oligopeptide transporter family [Verrucomicrobiales bacterium]|nr:proton-dependent oligopeptide transporter family [Verrucomicrobiales bacterium]